LILIINVAVADIVKNIVLLSINPMLLLF